MSDISFFTAFSGSAENLYIAAFIAGVWTVTVLSPGPNLLATLHATAKGGARAGVTTAAGIGLADVIFARPPVAAAYGRARRWIERATGALFVAAGPRLAADRG